MLINLFRNSAERHCVNNIILEFWYWYLITTMKTLIQILFTVMDKKKKIDYPPQKFLHVKDNKVLTECICNTL